MYRHGPLGFWKELRDHLDVNVKVETAKTGSSDKPVIIHFDIGNIIPRDSEPGPEIVFEEILLRVGKPPDMHTEKFTNLGIDQWLSYDYQCNYIDNIYEIQPVNVDLLRLLFQGKSIMFYEILFESLKQKQLNLITQ